LVRDENEAGIAFVFAVAGLSAHAKYMTCQSVEKSILFLVPAVGVVHEMPQQATTSSSGDEQTSTKLLADEYFECN
jgi:hypothetical protein